MMFNFNPLLEKLCDGQDLSTDEMQSAIRQVLSGAWTPVQISAFLIALKIKQEKPNEITAAATVMRELATPVHLKATTASRAVDTCGTGGDGGKTFNISTTAAFVVAACGVPVAKHGNRAMSGASGSSDVLEALGIPLNFAPERIAHFIETIGIGFIFAPHHHTAMKYAAPVRKELGLRTLFNLLGPLSNPAAVKRQVIGIFSPDWLLPYAEALSHLGATHALIVHGSGLDEISISGETSIAEVKNGMITRTTLSPEDVGLSLADNATLRVSSTEESKHKLLSVLAGGMGAKRDIVLLNAAAALIVADQAKDFSDGVSQAAIAIDSGAAQKKLDDFIAATNL